MKCPLCNRELIKDNIMGLDVMVCPTEVTSSSYCGSSHYTEQLNLHRYVMIIMPYRIITFPNYSQIQKYFDIGGFAGITDTEMLNIDPIFPQSEEKLRRRLETILVFS